MECGYEMNVQSWTSDKSYIKEIYQEFFAPLAHNMMNPN